MGHLLASSAICQETLRRRLNQRGAQIPERLVYRTELVESGAEGRPDVVGAIGNSRHVIVEGKFWASLTDSQPLGYLDSLADEGCLLRGGASPPARNPTRRVGTPLQVRGPVRR